MLHPTNGCSHSNNIPFLCCLCTNEIPDIVFYVTNQDTGNCNQHRFPAFSNSAFDRSFSMEETPKKVLHWVIVALSVPLQFGKYKKNYIFEKSYFDFPAMISSCLDVNVSCYLATSELSVCKACYRRLIKFKKASDHLKKPKDELKGIFKDRELPRTKRLLDVESDGGETQASCRGKSSKCLQFDPISTTCTSNATANSSISTAISQQVRYYTPARFPIGFIGVFPTVFKVIYTDLCYKLPLVKWQ